MNEDTPPPASPPTHLGDAPPTPRTFVQEFEKRHGPGRWHTAARELVVSSICCNVIEFLPHGQGLTYRTVFDWKSVTDPVDLIVRAVADTHGSPTTTPPPSTTTSPASRPNRQLRLLSRPHRPVERRRATLSLSGCRC